MLDAAPVGEARCRCDAQFAPGWWHRFPWRAARSPPAGHFAEEAPEALVTALRVFRKAADGAA